jgi:hypothetical protein
MLRELAVLWVVVSSAAELVLGCSPNEIFRVEVMDELVAEFQRLDELCSRLERPSVRICDLLLGMPLGQAWWADSLGEAARWLGLELATGREVDAEFEALQTSATRVRDLVLDNVNGPSSLEINLSVVVELLEGWIDTKAANGVRWGTRFVFIATLSHFS